MKRFVLGFVLGTVVTAGGAAVAAPDVVKLIVDGREVASDVPPQIIGGRVLVPARALAEALGAKVAWDGENRAVVISKGTGDTSDRGKLFSITLIVDGALRTASAVYGTDGDVCIPLRIISDFAPVSSPPHAPSSTVSIMIQDVLFTQSDFLVVEGRTFMCRTLLSEKLGWRMGWDAAGLQLTITLKR